MTTPAEAAIRAEIGRRGPIPFAEFMALALGHAEGGYYATAAVRPTRGGDFLTAPELHPVFGAALARQVAEAWERVGRPARFTLIEYGAGAGTLALAILAGLRDDGSPLADVLVYAPVEMNRHRLAELAARAAAVGLLVVDPTGPDGDPVPGIVLANEFLDALPVHLLEVRGGRAREVRVSVGADGAFEEMLDEPSDRALRDRLEGLARDGISLVEGQRLEIRPAVAAWALEVGRRLEAGLILAIDYGAPAADLYGPRRRAGTLMTYRGHLAEGDPGAPYRDVGERDITAHVDTTALGSALAGAGLDLLGETSQAELLVG
ncbi:MAG: SAM-dependent methyltransferase, partial [Chloroflexota bacterium]